MPKIVSRVHTPALQAADLAILMQQGWDDALNSAVSSLAWFKNQLYCGTTRASLCLLTDEERAFQWRQAPVPCEESAAPEQQGAQIYSLAFPAQQWSRVWQSPLQKRRGGKTAPYDRGYTVMTVWQGESDEAPALYVGTLGFRGGAGARILRSADGQSFEAVKCPDPGRAGLSAINNLIAFKGQLWAALTQTQIAAAATTQATHNTIFVTPDPRKKNWQAASQPGFGQAANCAISAMAVFNEYLYAATFNPVQGFQVWKTAAEGKPPYIWHCVLDKGAQRPQFNRGITAMAVFKQQLYLGTGHQDSVAAQAHRAGVAGAELIRLDIHDRWELVMGAPRLTPRGAKGPLSGLKPGFNHYFNRDISQLSSYNGHLYAGTFNWAGFLPYLETKGWPETLQKTAAQVRPEAAGLHIWHSEDGEHWQPLTHEGLGGNRYHCGVSVLLPSTKGLFIGTLNPFGPELADPALSAPARYHPNPQAGAGLWLGKASGRASQRSPEAISSPVKDPRLYDLDPVQLRQMQAQIHVAQALPAAILMHQAKQPMTVHSPEHLPASGAALLVANHPAIPVLAEGLLFMEDTLLILAQLAQLRAQPVRYLAHLDYYASEMPPSWRATLATLGYVPNTLANALHLLQQGQAVLMHPEGQPSQPGYQLRPFQTDMVVLAWQAHVPLIPLILLGPQERHLVVESQGQAILVNPACPLPVNDLLMVMPPVPVRKYVTDVDNLKQVAQFCHWLQQRMQAQIEQLVIEHRPWVKLARRLQKRFGTYSARQQEEGGEKKNG